MDRKRLVVVLVALSLLFSLLIARFYQIQVIEGEKWTNMALAQHQSMIVEPFMRGSFYSNTSVKPNHPEGPIPFVVDVPKFHLFIDPDSIAPQIKERMSKELGSLLKFNAEQIKKVRQEFERKSRCRKLAMWLDAAEKERIFSWWTAFASQNKIVKNALFFSSDYQRSYPFGTMLGSVLHTVQAEKDPHTFQSLPTGGLEMVFHSYLKGKQGKRLIVHSPRNPLDTGKLVETPENGADVYLTINHYLQAIAETELAKGVQSARAKGGWAVMMDPYSGEILALAQIPTFDPSRYAEFFNDPALQEATRVKVVSDCFEPGSIFKPLTMALCLKANEELARQGKKPIFTPEEKIATSNGWFPGRSKPLNDGMRVHKYLNMNLAIQKSSNIYPARLVQRLIETMGDQWYRKALEETFGFGQKTMIELPAESPGLVPTPGKLHPNGKLEWSVPTPYSLALGYNILLNGIQIVRAYAVLANGGRLIQPHIVRKIARKTEGGGETVLLDRTNPKALASKQVLSSSITQTVIKAMKFTTKEGGTARRGDVPGYTEVGKSGTAEKVLAGQYAKQHNLSSFLGFVPAQNPRFVLLVSIDDPEIKIIPGVGKHQLGGVCASPVFREISLKALRYLGVDPDDPYGYPPGDPRRDADKADWAFEVNVLKKLYQQWNEQ